MNTLESMKYHILNNLSEENIENLIYQIKLKPKLNRCFITVSGYEKRCIFLINKLLQSIEKVENNINIVLGFKEFSDIHSRRSNDDFYIKNNLNINILNSENWQDVKEILIKEINRIDADKKIEEIHVDYSSMPRSWYCNLPIFLRENFNFSTKIFFWYTPGHYNITENYPTSGIDNFKRFCGSPHLNPLFRTHIIGLGFDSIRSNAICSVLDPDNLVCYYSDPGSEDGYSDKVRFLQKNLLLNSGDNFTVPMPNFISIYSKLNSKLLEYLNLGDVILVPDGPKPLILASSLCSKLINTMGLVCIHVNKQKNHNLTPIDVEPIGSPIGFSF